MVNDVLIFLYCCVMYSGVECVVCCYSECISTPGKLKNQPDHGGNRTRDLWFASLIFLLESFILTLSFKVHIFASNGLFI